MNWAEAKKMTTLPVVIFFHLNQRQKKIKPNPCNRYTRGGCHPFTGRGAEALLEHLAAARVDDSIGQRNLLVSHDFERPTAFHIN